MNTLVAPKRTLHGSSGASAGVIGAIYGWIMKIKRSTSRAGVMNLPSLFSRKGFFGINVQVIVDKNKRILYRDIASRGAEHDSTAFKHTPLYHWCLRN